MPQAHDDGSLAVRLSNLEAQFAESQPATTTKTVTPAVATTTTTTSGGMSYYPVVETALGLTQDGAWHDGYSAPAVVPSDAKFLVLMIREDEHANIAVAQQFLIATDATHTRVETDSYANSNSLPQLEKPSPITSITTLTTLSQ